MIPNESLFKDDAGYKTNGPGRCRNCSRMMWLRSRGLCAMCYDDESIRSRFPAKDEGKQRRGIGLTAPNRMPKPTKHWPGTVGKLRVMIERAERGEKLFHPLDAGMFGSMTNELD